MPGRLLLLGLLLWYDEGAVCCPSYQTLLVDSADAPLANKADHLEAKSMLAFDTSGEKQAIMAR